MGREVRPVLYPMRALSLQGKMLLNQTWICSPAYHKDNLLTLDCGEGTCSVYYKAKQGVWATDAQSS